MSERLNLDILIISILHSHLYMRLDGTEAGNSNYVSSIERKNGAYTSPRNIRKIFIKESGIDVVYYRPIAGRGKGLSETINFNSDTKRLIQAAYEDYINRGEDRRVSIVGTGFTALAKNFSLSNLEELYFDWTLLLGSQVMFYNFMRINNDLKDYAIQGLSVKEYEFYTEVNTTKTQKFSILQASKADDTKIPRFLLSYIEDSIGSSILENFPRLKYIGFIGNSKETLRSEGELTNKKLIFYEFHAIYNQHRMEELKPMLCKGDKFRFCVFVDTGVNLFKAPFRVDSALYKFDADCLYDYLKASVCSKETTKEAELTNWFINKGSTQLGLESKLHWIEQFRAGELIGQREARISLENIKAEDKDAVEKTDIKPRNDLEQTLSRIKNEQDLQFTLRCLVMKYSKEDLLRLFSEFSPGGRDYYTKKLNYVED